MPCLSHLDIIQCSGLPGKFSLVVHLGVENAGLGLDFFVGGNDDLIFTKRDKIKVSTSNGNGAPFRIARIHPGPYVVDRDIGWSYQGFCHRNTLRSEERRVGKECRSRW